MFLHFRLDFICGNNTSCRDVIHPKLHFGIKLFICQTADRNRLCGRQFHIERNPALKDNLF